MKTLSITTLLFSLMAFTSCSHLSNHSCCQKETRQECKDGCKPDKSCCKDECKKCDGKSSCKDGKCNLPKKK